MYIKRTNKVSPLKLEEGEITLGLLAKKLEIDRTRISVVFSMNTDAPKFIKKGTIRVYNEKEITDWLETKLKTTTISNIVKEANSAYKKYGLPTITHNVARLF